MRRIRFTLSAMIGKGVDLVGWRTCARQKEWGPKRFALTLKKIGRQTAELATMPAPTGAAHTPDQRKRLQYYEELKQSAAVFQQGTPECRDCALTNGTPYGCHTFIDYPIDAEAERALFEYFAANVTEENTTCSSLYRDVVSKVATSGTAWHKDRGPVGSLAELDEPLVKEWGFLMWKKRVDSAQILGSLFFNQTRAAIIAAFAKFWEEFTEDARKRDDFASSKTMQQFVALSEFYDRVSTAASTQDGVYVIVENDAPSEPKSG
jgi:hypothetical protein